MVVYTDIFAYFCTEPRGESMKPDILILGSVQDVRKKMQKCQNNPKHKQYE